jgi:hypothetical protein
LLANLVANPSVECHTYIILIPYTRTTNLLLLYNYGTEGGLLIKVLTPNKIIFKYVGLSSYRQIMPLLHEISVDLPTFATPPTLSRVIMQRSVSAQLVL